MLRILVDIVIVWVIFFFFLRTKGRDVFEGIWKYRSILGIFNYLVEYKDVNKWEEKKKGG